MMMSAIAVALALTQAAPAGGAEVTYARDVAPILFRHCAECHRPGEVAPFPLLTYQDARKRAQHLKKVTTSRRMPPWHAEAGAHKFLDERRLSDAEIKTLALWADSGAKEGDPKHLPAVPTFPEGWRLGKPDLVLELPKPFTVPAGGPDIIQLFALRIPFDKVKYLRGLEFRPDNRKVVHHANLYLDGTGTLRKFVKDGMDASGLGLGFEQAGVETLQGLIGAWVPGITPRFLPDGVAQPVRPGTDLIVGIHYHPSGRPEVDRSSVGLYFSDAPGRTFTATWPVAICPPRGNTHLLDIPAGKKDHAIRLSSDPLPADATAYGIYAHGHYLMRQVRVTATLPDGKALDLLRIKDWDFNWQDRFCYAEPVRLPRGTRLDVSAVFDNSADNLQNPSSPPRDVRFGPKTDDEMFSAIVMLLPDRLPVVPPGGVPIPEGAGAQVRKRLDKDGDGRLSEEELAAAPGLVRMKFGELVRAGFKGGPPPAKPEVVKDDGRLKLPPGGVPIPEQAKVLREKFDRNKDGRLTQDELDAMPDEVRAQVEKSLRARLAKTAQRPAAEREATFARDVAPILFKHCAVCHRPGEVAPFPLLTYQDARKRAPHLKEVTADRRMPPWHAEAGPHKFLDERRLSDEEIKTLARWADAGAPEGDPKQLPPVPTFPDGWRLGKPDLVVKMPKPFAVPAGGPDVYRAFVIPLGNDEVKWSRAVEFRPGNRRVIHHCNFFLDTTGQMRKRAAKEGDGVSFPIQNLAGELLALQGTAGELGGWAPGTTPRFMPEGVARPIKPGADLIIHVHYHPSGKAEEDQSSVGLFFSPQAPTKMMIGVPLLVSPGMRNAELLNIPAGKNHHQVELSVTMPADAQAYAVQPHAHYLLKRLTVTATSPEGKAGPLIVVKNWDMNWQDRYYYAEPVRLAKGTKLDMVAVFDNSADNPQNPSSPPKDVKWGLSSTDEMLNTFVFVMGEGPEAAEALRARFGRGGGGGKAGPVEPLRLPAGGLAIPEGAKLLREKYDKDKDGKLTQEEYDAIPEFIRGQVAQVLRQRLGAAAGKKEDGPAKGPAPRLKLPAGGVPIPEQAKLVREKFDKNKDGKLTQDEVDAMPDEVRAQVEKSLAARLGGTAVAPEAPKQGAKGGRLLLPKEGLPIPEQAKLIRERFDKNKDGRLTQEELDAIPEPVRQQVEDILRPRLEPALPQPPGKGPGKGQ